MRGRRFFTLPARISIVVVSLFAASECAAQLVVLEPGFTVTPLPSGTGSVQIECSPGGVWGNYVYVGDTGGTIDRIDFSDVRTPFATGFTLPMGISFGPGPALNFGDFIYVSDNGANATRKVTPAGVVSPHASVTAPGSTTFDPLGAYGNALFVPNAGTGPIRRVNPAGTVNLHFPVPATYIKFGPGGSFGSGMFATSGPDLVKLDVLGVLTAFSSGFQTPGGFDWGTVAGFGGDLFATDVTPGQIWRVRPDRSRTLWATLPLASDVASCNGALYVVSSNGTVYRVNELPVPVKPATFGAIKALYR